MRLLGVAGLVALLALSACTSSSSPKAALTPVSSPSGSPPASPSTSDRPATFVLDDPQTGVDFYRWSDGGFVRRITPWRSIFASPDGQFYVDDETGGIFTAGGAQIDQVAGWNSGSWMWAGDGDYLCGSGLNGYGYESLHVVDPTGADTYVTVIGTGSLQNIFGCSLGMGRAVVLENVGFTVFSLKDGRLERTIAQPKSFTMGIVSTDTRLLALLLAPTSVPTTEIVDLDTGAVLTSLTVGYVDTFSPDGNSLVTLDESQHRVRLVDWRSGRVLWEAVAQSLGRVLVSDPATDSVLVEAINGSTITRWIVDGAGRASAFTPQP